MRGSAPKSLVTPRAEYSIGRLINRRGYVDDYRGEEVGTGRAVEVVLYEPGDRDFWEAYRVEVLELVRRIRHENVARLIEHGWHEGRFFAICELVEGPEVAELVGRARRRGERLPPSFGAYVGARAARGLEAGHRLETERGTVEVLHGEIVPGRIAVGDAGVVKVLEWGTVRQAPPSRGCMGPKVYALAPERLDGRPSSVVDGRADQFELGAVIFEMIAGKRPFSGETDYRTIQLIMQGVRPDYETALAHVPAGLRAAVETALEHRREDRFATASEMAASLEEQARGFGPEEAAEVVRSF